MVMHTLTYYAWFLGEVFQAVSGVAGRCGETVKRMQRPIRFTRNRWLELRIATYASCTIGVVLVFTLPPADTIVFTVWSVLGITVITIEQP